MGAFVSWYVSTFRYYGQGFLPKRDIRLYGSSYVRIPAFNKCKKSSSASWEIQKKIKGCEAYPQLNEIKVDATLQKCILAYNVQTIYLHVAVVIQFFSLWGLTWMFSVLSFQNFPNTNSHCLLLACRWPNGEWVPGDGEKKRIWKKQV